MYFYTLGSSKIQYIYASRIISELQITFKSNLHGQSNKVLKPNSLKSLNRNLKFCKNKNVISVSQSDVFVQSTGFFYCQKEKSGKSSH